MKMKKTIIQFITIGLFICNSKADRINEHWYGTYDIYIIYGEANKEFDAAAQFIDYAVEINKDSCTFSGLGTQTHFEYLCEVKENRNELRLLYLKIIDGFDFRNLSPLDTIATLIKDDRQYYIKSSIIADKDWKYNKKLPLNKDRKK